MEELPVPMRVRDLRALGVSRHEIDQKLPRMFWGIRGVEEEFSIPARCVEFLPRMPKVGFYSHSTAAILWGVPLPRRFESCLDLHVSVPQGFRAPDAAQIVGHQVAIRSEDVVMLDGLRVSSPARTWRELAALLDPVDLIAAGDALVHHRRALTSIEALRTVTLRDRTYPGRRYARDALPHLSDRAESRPESLLRIALWKAGLPAVWVNSEIMDVQCRFVARVDLRFRDFPIAVEYDGDQHRSDPAQWRRDVARLCDITEAGIAVIRATADDLPHFETVIERCHRLLGRHGWRP